MPTDKLALVGVGLLLNGVVDEQDSIPSLIILFKLAHHRLDQTPQRPGIHLLGGEKAGDPVVAYLSRGHGREAGGGDMSE